MPLFLHFFYRLLLDDLFWFGYYLQNSRASERDMGSMVRTSERSKTMWMLHSLIFISSYSYVVTFISMSSYKSLRYCFSSPGGLIDVIGKKERKKNHLCRKNLLIYWSVCLEFTKNHSDKVWKKGNILFLFWDSVSYLGMLTPRFWSNPLLFIISPVLF